VTDFRESSGSNTIELHIYMRKLIRKLFAISSLQKMPSAKNKHEELRKNILNIL